MREDETAADGLELLKRYRKLCEAAGVAAAAGHPLPRETRDQLTRIEAELQARLWLASAERQDSARETPGKPGRTASDPRNGRLPRADGVPADEIPVGGATVYCDGACIGNPGPGGYGVLVRLPGAPEQTFSAGKARTTNNEMELTAALAGLKAAFSMGARQVNVISDSEYLVKGMTSWVRGWLRNGWKTRSGEPVKNRALWEELDRLCQGEPVTWSWTRGHAGQPENELCDRLAVAAAEEAARGQNRTK